MLTRKPIPEVKPSMLAWLLAKEVGDQLWYTKAHIRDIAKIIQAVLDRHNAKYRRPVASNEQEQQQTARKQP